MFLATKWPKYYVLVYLLFLLSKARQANRKFKAKKITQPKYQKQSYQNLYWAGQKLTFSHFSVNELLYNFQTFFSFYFYPWFHFILTLILLAEVPQYHHLPIYLYPHQLEGLCLMSGQCFSTGTQISHTKLKLNKVNMAYFWIKLICLIHWIVKRLNY